MHTTCMYNSAHAMATCIALWHGSAPHCSVHYTLLYVAVTLCREAVGEDRVHCRSVHFSECPEKWKTGHLTAQLEAEKMERSR